MNDMPAPTSVTRIGDVAPNFLARSTQGPFELSALRGHWVLLFSHPADFTPVCTSEFLGFARAKDEFDALDCRLVGYSIDTLFAHFAWLKAIKDEFGMEVTFPLVEDPTMEIGRAFGMVGEDARDASAIRSTYVIDPDGVVQAITTYPTNVGRSVPELLRLVAALQATWRSAQLAPEGWQQGDPLMRAASTDFAEIMGSKSPAAWFFRSGKAG